MRAIDTDAVVSAIGLPAPSEVRLGAQLPSANVTAASAFAIVPSAIKEYVSSPSPGVQCGMASGADSNPVQVTRIGTRTSGSEGLNPVRPDSVPSPAPA